jgi:taurine dioxygenase
MGAATTMTVRRASGTLGAIVEGADLSVDVSDVTVDTLKALLDEHLVLFVPGQHLDDAAQLALALRFGEFYVHPLARAVGATEPRCGHIVDDADHPPFQDTWHTDVSWDPEPPTHGFLRMIDRPAHGGDTLFADMYAAYDRLSEPMRTMLDGLTAWHTMGEGQAFRSKGGDAVADAAGELVPGAQRNVIGVHPRTGRRYLDVNAAFTRSIVELSPTESQAVLALLFAHVSSPNHQVRWVWSPGDLVIWDERPTQHLAVADHYPQRREVARVNVIER